LPDVVGVGVIGCGNVATRYHVPAHLRTPGVQIVAAADPSVERLHELGAAAGIDESRLHADYHDLLARNDVGFVDICVPQHLHTQVALDAAAAGKHILCEKPITTVPQDGRRIIAAAEAAGVTVGVMHNYLFFPEFLAAHEVIASGGIGDVRLVIVNYLGVPDLPGAEGSWRHDPTAAGGGVLVDMVHALYVAEYLAGAQARRVSAYITGNASHPHVEATALCRLETDGPAALVNVGWGIGPGGVFVEGERGSVEIRWRNGGTNPFEPLEWIEVRTAGGTRRLDVPHLELGALVIEGMAGIISDFVDAISTGSHLAADGEDGLHALELALGSYASAALGRTVVLPLGADDPVYQRGVAAIPDLDGPAWSPVRRQPLYRLD